jgi:hypothetical protein
MAVAIKKPERIQMKRLRERQTVAPAVAASQPVDGARFR